MRSFSFLLKNAEFQKKMNLSHLNQLSENIRNTLFATEKYEIQSDVDITNLQSFLDNFVDKIPLPTITSDNIYDFRQLSAEFNILTDYLSSEEFDTIYKISVLKNAKSDTNKDRSQYEECISQNLDFFIKNHSDELRSLPLNSLYNIFYGKNRKLEDMRSAYKFITDSEADDCLFVLLGSLDCAEMDDEAADDSVLRRDERFGFAPRFSIERYKKLRENESAYEAKLKEKEATIEAQRLKLKEYESAIEKQKLESSENEKTIEKQQQQLKEYESVIEKQKLQLNEKDMTIAKQQQQLKDYGAVIEKQKLQLNESLNDIERLKKRVADSESALNEKDVQLNELQKTIESLKRRLREIEGGFTVREGAEVRVKQSAKQFGKNVGFASSVYSQIFVVKEIKGERAVIFSGKTCIGAVHVNDLLPP